MSMTKPANITIRPAKAGDYGSVRELLSELADDKKRFAKAGNDSFHRFLKMRDAYINLAIVNNKPVGLITYALRYVVRHPRPILEVEELVVSEKFRGKKIGKQLMQRALSVAKKRNCQYVLLHSNNKRKGAHKFYKRLKFEQESLYFRRKP